MDRHRTERGLRTVAETADKPKRAGVLKWKKGTDKDGNPSKYFETNGTHNVCAIRINGVEWYERWRVDTRPHVCEGRYMTAAEAKRGSA